MNHKDFTPLDHERFETALLRSLSDEAHAAFMRLPIAKRREVTRLALSAAKGRLIMETNVFLRSAS